LGQELCCGVLRLLPQLLFLLMIWIAPCHIDRDMWILFMFLSHLKSSSKLLRSPPVVADLVFQLLLTFFYFHSKDIIWYIILCATL
jgi:hypothetical protein